MVKKRKTEYKIRNYDAQLADDIDELYGKTKSSSQNSFFLSLLRIAVAEVKKKNEKEKSILQGKPIVNVFSEFTGVEKTASEAHVAIQEILKTVQNMKTALDDLSDTTKDMWVVQKVQEYLQTVQFNVKVSELNGEPVSEEMIEDGILNNLPPYIEQLRVENINNRQKHKKKEK